MSGHKVPISPLGQFFGGYVHQDFADFHPSAWAAVEDFVANEPLERRQAARSELAQLLANCHTDDELSDAVDRVIWTTTLPAKGSPIGSGSRRSSVICASTRSDGARHRDLGAPQSAFGVVMSASSAV
jgi:hypothetical protein